MSGGGVDWNDVESVVRAAVPDARCLTHVKGRRAFKGIVSKGAWLQTCNHQSAEAAWKEVRDNHPSVLAWVEEHGPKRCEACGTTLPHHWMSTCVNAMAAPSPKAPEGDTAPLECTQCGRAIGPMAKVDADHPGWICPECYANLQAPEGVGEGRKPRWDGLEGHLRLAEQKIDQHLQGEGGPRLGIALQEVRKALLIVEAEGVGEGLPPLDINHLGDAEEFCARQKRGEWPSDWTYIAVWLICRERQLKAARERIRVLEGHEKDAQRYRFLRYGALVKRYERDSYTLEFSRYSASPTNEDIQFEQNVDTSIDAAATGDNAWQKRVAQLEKEKESR